MCYEDKIVRLADAIHNHVADDFCDVNRAQLFAISNTKPMNSRTSEEAVVAQRIQCLAETLAFDTSYFGIQPLMDDIGTDDIRTKYSALREAIVLCARRYIQQANEAQLGMAIA